MRSWLRNYSLGIALGCLWLASTTLHAIGEKWSDSYDHGQTPWAVDFFTSTFENWQSEFLQLIVQVSFTAWLVFQGSPNSRSSEEETMAALNRIETLARSINEYERLNRFRDQA